MGWPGEFVCFGRGGEWRGWGGVVGAGGVTWIVGGRGGGVAVGGGATEGRWDHGIGGVGGWRGAGRSGGEVGGEGGWVSVGVGIGECGASGVVREIATVETVNNGEQQLYVIVDGQRIVITEASVRRHLQLADADGISSLPNTESFEQLTLIGTSSEGGPRCHFTIGDIPVQARPKRVSNFPNEPLLREDKVTSLEDDLASTKAVYNKALITLTKRESPIQGRMIEEINKDETVNLVKISFVLKISEIEKEVMKRPGFDLQQESSKKTRGSKKKTLARKRVGEKQSKEGAKRQKDQNMEK
ncbi:hypothetical protein Tco_0774900 [Tanacetum coccineum]|uniref:Uncharacterized protein n=1 Tax=Tanacetum coccineum TaxID=301880 RepID=A0ABQ4ZPT2_9ASTR